MLKRLIEFLRGAPKGANPTRPVLVWTEPTRRFSLDSGVLDVLALAHVAGVDATDVAPVLELLASQERWEDYVELDDKDLLPSERSQVIQRLVSDICPELTKRQAARYLAYKQVRGLAKFDFDWWNLAGWDPDLRQISSVSFIDDEHERMEFRALTSQLCDEYEDPPAA